MLYLHDASRTKVMTTRFQENREGAEDVGRTYNEVFSFRKYKEYCKS